MSFFYDTSNDISYYLELTNTSIRTSNTKLDTVNTSIGTSNTKLDTVNTSIETSNTKLDTVNTSIGTSNTKLDTVNTSIGTSNTKLDTINTTLNMGTLSVVLGDHRNLSAFGEIETVTVYPVCQVDFVYGINTLLFSTSTVSTGSITSSNSMCVVSTGTGSTGEAVLTTRRYIKYRAGQGCLCKFTAVFSSPANNSTQLAGCGNSENGVYFGYQNTTFGIFYINNNSTTFISKDNWNGDAITFDPLKGNLYKITYQYLGFGSIHFFMEQITGLFVKVHEIYYANSATVPSFTNPSFNIIWRAINNGNTSNLVVRGASGALFIEGIRRFLGPQFGFRNSKANVTTAINIFTLKNCTTFNGKNNRSQVRLRNVSFAANAGGGNSSAIITLQIILNCTLGGSPSYTCVNGSTVDNGTTITSGNSVTNYDVAGTTITGGICVYNSLITVNGSVTVDLSENDIFINPGEILTFAIDSSASVTAGCAANWNEDI